MMSLPDANDVSARCQDRPALGLDWCRFGEARADLHDGIRKAKLIKIKKWLVLLPALTKHGDALLGLVFFSVSFSPALSLGCHCVKLLLKWSRLFSARIFTVLILRLISRFVLLFLFFSCWAHHL